MSLNWCVLWEMRLRNYYQITSRLNLTDAPLGAHNASQYSASEISRRLTVQVWAFGITNWPDEWQGLIYPSRISSLRETRAFCPRKTMDDVIKLIGDNPHTNCVFARHIAPAFFWRHSHQFNFTVKYILFFNWNRNISPFHAKLIVLNSVFKAPTAYLATSKGQCWNQAEFNNWNTAPPHPEQKKTSLRNYKSVTFKRFFQLEMRGRMFLKCSILWLTLEFCKIISRQKLWAWWCKPFL